MQQRMVSHLAASLATREQARRRLTLVANAGVLLLSTSPVFGHHVSSVGQPFLLGLDHLGALCLTALHILLEPVHGVFHIVIVAGLTYAIWDRVRAWLKVRRAVSPLEMHVPVAGDPFWEAARAASVDPGVLRVVEGLPNPAFTAGWLEPRIYVAATLANHLSLGELAALLAHEGAHVARRDPLRLSLLRFFACTLFWIPALRRLAADLADEAEVMADDAAAADPLVLASAILNVAHWPYDARGSDMQQFAGVGFFRPDLFDRRIRRLAGEDTVVRTHVTRRSIVGAAMALSLVWSSGILAAHPMSASERAHHGGHCQHRGEAAFKHLFCVGFSPDRAEGNCPHGSAEL